MNYQKIAFQMINNKTKFKKIFNVDLIMVGWDENGIMVGYRRNRMKHAVSLGKNNILKFLKSV